MPETPDTRILETTWGTISVDLVDGKVVRCTLPYVDEDSTVPFAITKRGNDTVSAFIAAALTGKIAKVPALGKLGGTVFQHQVWNAIAAVPAGQTMTYGELSQSIGKPSATRAAANACGQNPVPLFIPCHRIIGARGALGGFSAGLAWKRLIRSTEKQ